MRWVGLAGYLRHHQRRRKYNGERRGASDVCRGFLDVDRVWNSWAGSAWRGRRVLSPHAKIYALLDGRFNVAIDDVRAVATPALRHRLILNFEGEAEGITSEAIVRSILDAVAPPTVE